MNQRNLLALLAPHFLRTALMFACCLPCLAAGARSAKEVAAPDFFAPPAWSSFNPSNFQFNMNMVIRVTYNGSPTNASGNLVGVFVGSELRGFATPTVISGQSYYFLTVYAHQYIGETLSFRVYYAPDDKVYSTLESASFFHNIIIGTRAAPYWININSNADFVPEITPIAPDTTLQSIPFDPLNLATYLNSLDGDPVTWSAVPGPNLSAVIVNGVLTVAPLSPGWTGTDIVTIKATENTANQYAATRVAQFTVLPDYGPPVLLPIPPQNIFPGGVFTNFDLDNYLTFGGPCRAFDFDVFPCTGSVPDPAWPVVLPGAQPMRVVARPVFADEALAGPGAKLAAFVNNTLVGSAGPTGTLPNVSYDLLLKNVGTGPITFRFYHAENQCLYEKTTTLQFTPGSTVGTVASAYDLQLSPLVPSLTAGGAVQVSIADGAWLGSYPVDFIVWDCNFPAARRDTVRALFNIGADNRPHLTSPSAVDFKEASCKVLYDATTTDPNSSEGGGLTYALAGGADVSKFSINSVNGKLSWLGFTPDFEMPGDANGDNQYEVIIRVTNALNLTDERKVTITLTDNAIESFQPQVNGGEMRLCLLGSAVLQATGGDSYQWSTGDPTTSIIVTTPGIYTVTISNDDGCSATLSVTASNRPVVTASGSDKPVCLGSNILLSAKATSGSGPHTFAWTGPNSFSSNASNPTAFPSSPAVAGTYTVIVTDSVGCSASATTIITVSGNSAPSITASNSGPLCSGATLTLQSTPAGGATPYAQFKWTGPGYSASSEDPVSFQASLTAAGTYTVTVTDKLGCTATGTTAVVVNPLPVATATSNSPVCAGEVLSLDATASGSTGPYVFQWTGQSGFSSMLEDPMATVYVANSGSYQVSITDHFGCKATASTTVKVNPLPTTTAATLAPVCVGGMVVLGSTPSGGSGTYSSFQWTGPGYSASAQNPMPFPVTPAVAGTYTVKVTDNAGCSAVGAVVVTIYPVPAITATNSGVLCAGSELQLFSTPSLGTLPYASFQWTGPVGYVASTEDPAKFTASAASAGIYEVKVTDSKGCTATATTEAFVKPTPSLAATNNSPVCTAANIFLQSNASGGSGAGYVFAWSGPGGYLSNDANPTGFPAVTSANGDYLVTVTDGAGCSATASTSVTVSTNAATFITATNDGPLCGGGTLTLRSFPTGGSGSYDKFEWQGPGFTSSLKNPTPFVAAGGASGTYTVTVTDSRGCTASNTVAVVVNAPKGVPSANFPICAGATVLLKANPTGSTNPYTAFKWAGPGGYTSMVENPTGFPATMASVGIYTVTVTDNMGCFGTGTLSLSLQNNSPPTIKCPTTDQEAPMNANCTGVVGNWLSAATDVSDDCTPQSSIMVTQMPVASTPLNGQNAQITVTLTADDGTGNTTPCSFKVFLKDKGLPTITCPGDQTVLADAVNCSGAVGDYTGLATNLTDNCTAPGSIAVTQTPPLGTPLNGHSFSQLVTLTASDGNGNNKTCTFNVTLKDQTPPTITCPADQTVASGANCSGPIGNLVGLATNLTDNCTAAGSIAVTQSPAANTLLSGHNDQKTVTLTSDDLHGNTTPCTFKVTLKDVTMPGIVCPGNLTRSTDVGQCSTTVTYSVISSDNCPGYVSTLTSGLPSGERFSKGVTSVGWKVVDVGGNQAECSFTITVADNEAPGIVCPLNLVRGTDPNLCSAIVSYSEPTITDNCPGVSSAIVAPSLPSGSVFLKGVSTVIWKAVDEAGNSRTCSFTVTVNDTQAPSITCPANILKTTDPNVCTAATTYTAPTATDNCTPAPTVALQSGLPSGAPFPKGVSTVIWRATDGAGLTKTCTFRVTVNDLQPPVVTCPPNIAKNTDPNLCTAVTMYANATFTDNCMGGSVVKVSGPSSGFAFPRGQSLVVFRATDGSGNTALCTLTITVTDAQLPTVLCPAPLSVVALPGECSAVVTYADPTATDNCAVTASFLKIGLASGSVFPLGTTTNTWQATDNSSLTKTCTFTITVACGPTAQDTGAEPRASTPTGQNPAVEAPGLPLTLDVVPNPATTEALIVITGMQPASQAGELTVLDAMGRIVWRQMVTADQERLHLDLSDQAFVKGLYFVTLHSGGQVAARRLVKVEP